MIVIYHFPLEANFRRRCRCQDLKSTEDRKGEKREEKSFLTPFCVFLEAVAGDWSQLVVKCLSFHLLEVFV
jgi:hypothetical protein